MDRKIKGAASTSSGSSSLSRKRIRQIIDKLKLRQFRDSTRRTYHTAWKVFSKFYLRLDIKLKTWEDRLTLFVGYMADQKKQSSTIRSYISAIKAKLKEVGIQLKENQYLLTSITKACKYKNHKAGIRLSIHKEMLKEIILQVAGIFPSEQPYLECLYKALFTVAYFGLFRVGELTKGSYPVLAKDVHITTNKKKILFICQFTALKNFLNLRRGFTSKHESFFIFRDGSLVTPDNFRNILKKTLVKARFDERLYNSHSFCIGRSCDLLKIVETIKKIGRWHGSNPVYTYLKFQ